MDRSKKFCAGLSVCLLLFTEEQLEEKVCFFGCFFTTSVNHKPHSCVLHSFYLINEILCFGIQDRRAILKDKSHQRYLCLMFLILVYKNISCGE